MGLFKGPRTAQRGSAVTIDQNAHDPAAARLRAWMEQREWPAAREFLATVAHPDDRAFYLSICADVDGVQGWIEEWVAADPHATLPVLVRGAHAVYWAWEARGAARANRTSQEQFGEFFRRLKLAEDCLDEVVERDPADSTAWTFLILSGRGRQLDRAAIQHRFAEATRGHPHHRMAHLGMLDYLCPKWFGSEEEMFDFARSAVAKGPLGSWLGELVARAHIEKWLQLPDGDDTAYLKQPDVVGDLLAAADQSVCHPHFERRPGWPTTRNQFAFAFSYAEQWDAAAEQFDAIGDRATNSPWQYCNHPAKAFTQKRDLAYRNRSTPPTPPTTP